MPEPTQPHVCRFVPVELQEDCDYDADGYLIKRKFELVIACECGNYKVKEAKRVE